MRPEEEINIELAILEAHYTLKNIAHQKLDDNSAFGSEGRMLRAEMNLIQGKIIALKWILNQGVLYG